MSMPSLFSQPATDPASADDDWPFPLNGQDLQTVSDEALIALYDTAPVIHSFGGTRIVRLSRTLALKGGSTVLPCEAQNMSFASAYTRIPVPKVHRVLNIQHNNGYWGTTCFIVMDYVQGVCLEACWESMDVASRSDITSQVAAMIQELGSITLPDPPGPIGGTQSRFRGSWFSDYGAGPFGSLQELEDWCNHKLEICQMFRQEIPGTPRFEFDSLVFTHQDIAPRNLILGSDGQLWLVDWANAGAYPPGFERAALERQNRFLDFIVEVCEKITDYPVVAMQRRSIAYGLTTAALA